jgi:hypothetical protein
MAQEAQLSFQLAFKIGADHAQDHMDTGSHSSTTQLNRFLQYTHSDSTPNDSKPSRNFTKPTPVKLTIQTTEDLLPNPEP